MTTTRLLYNTDDLLDVFIVLGYIDTYTADLGAKEVALDAATVHRVVSSCRTDFPHDGGIEAASAFKQAANFICNFVAERPILEPFPRSVIGEDLSKIQNHQNAMVAFSLAESALLGSIIRRKDGDYVVTNPILYSRHSYVDIIDSLSSVSPVTSFKLVTVLLEQLVYKSNPGAQYPIPEVDGTCP